MRPPNGPLPRMSLSGLGDKILAEREFRPCSTWPTCTPSTRPRGRRWEWMSGKRTRQACQRHLPINTLAILPMRNSSPCWDTDQGERVMLKTLWRTFGEAGATRAFAPESEKAFGDAPEHQRDWRCAARYTTP